MTVPRPFAFEVTIDGHAGAQAYTLAGAQLRNGRSVWYNQPDPSTAVLDLLAADAPPPALNAPLSVDAVVAVPGPGAPHARLPGTRGAYLSVADTPPLRVTGDLDVRVDAALDTWTPAATSNLIGKRAGAQRSYELLLRSGGNLELQWMDSGTKGWRSLASSAGTGLAPGTRRWVRATLDADTGTGCSVSFATSPDGIAWTALGTPQASSTPAAIATSTAALEIGSNGNGQEGVVAMRAYRVQLRDAHGLVLDVDLATAGAGAATFRARTGQLVEVHAPAAVVRPSTPSRSRRFTGRVVAVEYAPGIYQVTAAGPLETVNRAWIGDTPWPAEPDTDRIARILDLAGVTKGMEGVPRARFQPRDADHRNAGDLARGYATQGGGILVDSRDGKARYLTAARLANPTRALTLPPAVTLTDGYAAALEAGAICNKAAVAWGQPVPTTQPDGSTAMIQPEATATDAASVAAFGERYERIGTDYELAADAQAYATAYVANRAQPRWHMPSVAVELALVEDPATLAAYAATDIGDVLTVAAPDHAPWTTYAGLVQGWVEVLAPDAWGISWDVARADTTPLGTVVWAEPDASYVWSRQALAWQQAVTLAQLVK